MNKLRLIALSLLGLPSLAQAQDSTRNGLKFVGDLAYGSGPTDPKLLIGRIVQVILGFIGYVFVVLIIVAGIQWMTSGGNEEKVTRAKNMLRNATIGLLLILIAYSIAFSINLWLSNAISSGPAVPQPTP